MSQWQKESHVVLFTDVHAFSVATRTEGVDTGALMQEMYVTLGDVVVNHGGEIIKNIGDSVLAIFPAGEEQRVVGAAIEMRRAFDAMPGWAGLDGESELEVGIGSGVIGVGTFGHPTLQTRDIFGDVINQVAAIGHHRGVAILRSVYESVKDSYETRALPKIARKREPEPLESWEIVGA